MRLSKYSWLVLSIFTFLGCKSKYSTAPEATQSTGNTQNDVNVINDMGKELPLTIKNITDRMSINGINTSNCSVGIRLGGMLNADPNKVYGTVRCGNAQCLFQVDMTWPTPNPNEHPQEFLDIETAWNNRLGPALDYTIIKFYFMYVVETP